MRNPDVPIESDKSLDWDLDLFALEPYDIYRDKQLEKEQYLGYPRQAEG